MIWLIAGFGLAVLGILLFFVLQIPETLQKKRKKKREPLPEPPKDWQTIAQRQEKRLQAMEQTLSSGAEELKGRDKKIEELNRAVMELKKQLGQEQAWREKSEALAAKEKKREHLLQAELDQARTSLNEESTRRIKQDQELKEQRQILEELTVQVRALSANKLQLERTLAEATVENGKFRQENMELRKKKEGEQWIARSDYKHLEGLLKRARWEADQFKKVVPVAQWPRPLQPRHNAAESVPPSVERESSPEAGKQDSSLQGV